MFIILAYIVMVFKFLLNEHNLELMHATYDLIRYNCLSVYLQFTKHLK